jgi:hypothetical protein
MRLGLSLTQQRRAVKRNLISESDIYFRGNQQTLNRTTTLICLQNCASNERTDLPVAWEI